METKIINMTPHPVHIVDDEGNLIRTYPPSGSLIRLKAETVRDGCFEDGTPFSRTVYGDPEGLPEYEFKVFYIVSQLVKNALPDRCDLLVPAEVVRDAEGNIIGCKSLGI